GIIATATIYPKWQKSGTEATLSWDVMGYYLYLPAALIYQDISQLQFKDTILKKYRPTGSFYQAYAHPKTGKYVMKYPIGLALLYLPFFALGHLYALTSDFPPDGFSLPYQAAISFGSMFFAFVGLWFCQQALRQYFANTIAGVVILLIALSTNYLNYTAVDGAMAHNWGFSLLAILLYYTIKWYEQPSYGKSILIGVCLGLAILVRPTNILGALIPIFWGLKDYAAFQERIELFQNSWKLLLVALFSVVAIGSIQLIYWKFITDDWIFYTYNEQGFSWFKPHVKNVLISYKKGWLMYTPIMILALTGFWYLYQNFRKLFPFCLVFFLVNFYIVSAWDVWGYGGAFGQRALIEGYTILAFPMAALLVHVQKLGWQRWLLIAFAIFCTWLNCFQTWQAHGHGFETEAMTKAYFWRIFANANPTELDRKLLDTKEDYQGERKKVEQIYWNDFEGIFEGNISTTAKAKSGKKSWLINGGIEFSPALTIKVEARSNEWLRVGADFFLVSKEWDVWKMTQLIVEFRKGEEIIKKRVIRVQRQLSENAWQKNWTDMKIPKIDFDTVRVYFWNPNSQKDLYIDDLTVETYEPS
ncbi:MAG: hypothetical protein AAGJ18_01620, partial [Bacteroidota bacterium]